MKITYERLNQIIEEEVVKFKKLNEDVSVGDIVKLIEVQTDAGKLKSALKAAIANIKDQQSLTSISSILGK